MHGYIAQWLERLTADQQVPGSNPGVPFSITRFFARSVLNLVVVGWSPTVGVCPNAFKMEDVETDHTG